MERVPWWDDARSVLGNDPELSDVVTAFPDEGLEIQDDPFLTLARAIVGQQISVRAADAVWGRLEALCEGTIDTKMIAGSNVGDLHSAGCSIRKGEYLIHAAKRIDALVKEGFDADDSEVVKRLTELRGVGLWTAEMFLIFALGRQDVFPVGDVGLIRGLQQVVPETSNMDSEDIKRFSERWAPWRTAATWYLWRVIDPVPVAY